jgi:hypothetical protein
MSNCQPKVDPKAKAKKKDCRFCNKTGLRFLPLVYAVIATTDKAALDSLPKISGKLGDMVTDLKLGPEARYAVRMLPPGYLYLLLNRKGVKYWKSYLVLEDAYLYELVDCEPPQTTPAPEFNCNPEICGIDASLIDIPKADEVADAWLLYAPSAMTKAKLDEYKANAESYGTNGKMQHFSPAGWLAGSTGQPHTVLAAELLTTVAEYALFAQTGDTFNTPLGKALQEQMIPALMDAYLGLPPSDKGCYPGRLGALYNSMRRNGYGGVVAFNHVGITQTLNDFRNAPLEGVQEYLAATDTNYGASNQWRLQVHEALRDLQAGYENGAVQSAEQYLENARQGSETYDRNQRATAKQLRATGRVADAEAVERDLARHIKTRDANRAKVPEQTRAEAAERWKKKYLSLLDESEMDRFHGKLKEHTRNAFTLAEKRAPDHLKWFESMRLADAFDIYDDKDTNSNYSFAFQSAICTLGSSGCKPYEDKIDAWVKAARIERNNLYMRGFYFNNAELIQAAQKELPAVGAEADKVAAASAIDGEKVRKLTKGLVSSFKSIDSAFDEWARKHTGKAEFGRKWIGANPVGAAVGKMAGSKALQSYGVEIMMFHKLSEITRVVFRSGMNTGFDKKLTATLGALLYSRLGNAAEKLGFNELLLQLEKTPPPKVAEGHKGRSAERNMELAKDKAARKSAHVARQVESSFETLLDDARTKVANKVKPTLKELVDNTDPPTNNYHHVRIGVLLGCLEMIGLGEKLYHNGVDIHQWDSKARLGVIGGIASVSSIVYDTLYAGAKSIREIEPYKTITPIEKGADIVRGRLKVIGGAFGFIAGGCSTYLDFMKISETKDPTLKWIYALRTGAGVGSTGLSLVAAFSYAGPWLESIEGKYAEGTLRRRLITGGIDVAERLVLRVRLLVWVARLNWVGLALTAAEIGYLLLKDDEMEAWCKMCVFRKKKQHQDWGGLGKNVDNDYYIGMNKELAALDKAGRAVGAGGVPNAEEDDPAETASTPEPDVTLYGP